MCQICSTGTTYSQIYTIAVSDSVTFNNLPLTIAEPRTVHVPYQTYMTSSDDDCQYHDHSQYTFGTGTPSANFLAFPSLLHDQKTTSDPWNSIHYQVPKYPTGFVAFAPSPVASLDCVSRAHESASPGTCSSMGSPRSGTSYDILPHPRRALARDKGKHVHLGWEHLTVFKGGLEHISDHTTVVPHRIGIRKGKLDPATKEKACRIRRLKACWNCWIQKVPVSYYHSISALSSLSLDLISTSVLKAKRAIHARGSSHPVLDSSVHELVLGTTSKFSFLVCL